MMAQQVSIVSKGHREGDKGTRIPDFHTDWL